MENTEPTHIVFDWEKIIVSPNLTHILDFIMEIEKETRSFLWTESKLNEIKNGLQDIFDLVIYLSKKLEENNIEHQYKFINHLDKLEENFNFHLPIRSQFIVLFANIETTFSLYTAFQKEIDDKDLLIKETNWNNENIINFINKFLLNNNNAFYKANRKRFSKISAKNFRKLRNTLTHFFSLDKHISLVPNQSEIKARKLENRLKEIWNNNSIFISPNDLFELINKANILLIKLWNDEYISNWIEFKRKIKFVSNIVKNNAPILIRDWDLNL